MAHPDSPRSTPTQDFFELRSEEVIENITRSQDLVVPGKQIFRRVLTVSTNGARRKSRQVVMTRANKKLVT